jgi:hypothetical protein
VHLAVLIAIAGSLATCSLTTPAVGASPPLSASSPRVAADDPIARLLDRLSTSHGLWRNGLFPSIELPRTATNEQVVSRVFELSSFDKGRVSDHRIVETRQIRIPGDQDLYTALLVKTNLGRKIVLLRFNGPSVGWWSRVYDADAA